MCNKNLCIYIYMYLNLLCKYVRYIRLLCSGLTMSFNKMAGNSIEKILVTHCKMSLITV